MSYLGLVGESLHCVQLVGITELPRVRTSACSEGGTCLFLVYERATEGHLIRHLEILVKQGDWKGITQALSSVFAGLSNLHSRGIIHWYVK